MGGLVEHRQSTHPVWSPGWALCDVRCRASQRGLRNLPGLPGQMSEASPALSVEEGVRRCSALGAWGPLQRWGRWGRR